MKPTAVQVGILMLAGGYKPALLLWEDLRQRKQVRGGRYTHLCFMGNWNICGDEALTIKMMMMNNNDNI